MVRLTKENMALGYNTSKAEKEVLMLKRTIGQLEESAKEPSQMAGSPSETKLIAAITKLNGELARAKAENSSQQDVFSQKIEDMSRKHDDTLSKYVAQTNTLHA